MANKRVSISYGRTVQPAPYESIKLQVSLEKDIPDGESVIDAVDKSVNGLRSYINGKLLEILKVEGKDKQTM